MLEILRVVASMTPSSIPSSTSRSPNESPCSTSLPSQLAVLTKAGSGGRPRPSPSRFRTPAALSSSCRVLQPLASACASSRFSAGGSPNTTRMRVTVSCFREETCQVATAYPCGSKVPTPLGLGRERPDPPPFRTCFLPEQAGYRFFWVGNYRRSLCGIVIRSRSSAESLFRARKYDSSSPIRSLESSLWSENCSANCFVRRGHRLSVILLL
jgi:hypothetical protein